MGRLRQVQATTEDARSRFGDDSDERNPLFFHRELLILPDHNRREISLAIADEAIGAGDGTNGPFDDIGAPAGRSEPLGSVGGLGRNSIPASPRGFGCGGSPLPQVRTALLVAYGLPGLFGVAIMIISAGVSPQVMAGRCTPWLGRLRRISSRCWPSSASRRWPW